MNKLTKISATALVALFLAACDKPADKAATNTQATEQTKTVVSAADAKADFDKILAWNVAQDKPLAEAQAALQAKVETRDSAQIQEGLLNFSTTIANIVKNLDAVEVSDAQIQAFKEKTKTVLTLSSEVIEAQVKAMASPDNKEAVEEAQQKSQRLIQENAEFEQLNVELEKRFQTQTK